MENCVMWSMVGTKVYKKCAQVYKLEERIKELEEENARLTKDYNCVDSLCNSIDEFGEPMKDNQWTFLGERIYEIVVELFQRTKKLEALRNTVSTTCNPPDDCKDPKVLKEYMKGCYDLASKLY